MEYLDYSLSHFLLFSPEIFYRQFELYHRAIFPAQLLMPVVFGLLVYCYRRAPTYFISAVCVALSLSCLVCAIGYHLRFYSDINWLAHYFAKIFIVQGLLLLFVAYRCWGATLAFYSSSRLYLGLFFLVYAVAIFPALDIVLRGSWMQSQLIGITPDPIMISILSMLLCIKTRYLWLLAILPSAWLLVSGLIFYTMDDYEGVTLIAMPLFFWIARLMCRGK